MQVLRTGVEFIRCEDTFDSASSRSAYVSAFMYEDHDTSLAGVCANSTSVCNNNKIISNKQNKKQTRLTALVQVYPGEPVPERYVQPIWILLKQETVSGSGISWAICKSAPRSRQITMPVPHHSGFYRPDALPAAQPTASKH